MGGSLRDPPTSEAQRFLDVRVSALANGLPSDMAVMRPILSSSLRTTTSTETQVLKTTLKPAEVEHERLADDDDHKGRQTWSCPSAPVRLGPSGLAEGQQAPLASVTKDASLSGGGIARPQPIGSMEFIDDMRPKMGRPIVTRRTTRLPSERPASGGQPLDGASSKSRPLVAQPAPTAERVQKEKVLDELPKDRVRQSTTPASMKVIAPTNGNQQPPQQPPQQQPQPQPQPHQKQQEDNYQVGSPLLKRVTCITSKRLIDMHDEATNSAAVSQAKPATVMGSALPQHLWSPLGGDANQATFAGYVCPVCQFGGLESFSVAVAHCSGPGVRKSAWHRGSDAEVDSPRSPAALHTEFCANAPTGGVGEETSSTRSSESELAPQRAARRVCPPAFPPLRSPRTGGCAEQPNLISTVPSTGMSTSSPVTYPPSLSTDAGTPGRAGGSGGSAGAQLRACFGITLSTVGRANSPSAMRSTTPDRSEAAPSAAVGPAVSSRVSVTPVAEPQSFKPLQQVSSPVGHHSAVGRTLSVSVIAPAAQSWLPTARSTPAPPPPGAQASVAASADTTTTTPPLVREASAGATPAASTTTAVAAETAAGTPATAPAAVHHEPAASSHSASAEGRGSAAGKQPSSPSSGAGLLGIQAASCNAASTSVSARRQESGPGLAGSPIAYDGRGRVMIARQVNPATGKARTVVQSNDGRQHIFGETTVASLLKSSEEHMSRFMKKLNNVQMRGLVHEVGQRLLQDSTIYTAVAAEWEALTKKNNFSFFGIPDNASEKELDVAYRKLAKQMHPDKNGGTEEAKRRFQQMKEKYEALKEEIRNDPDRHAGGESTKSGASRPDDTTDMDDQEDSALRKPSMAVEDGESDDWGSPSAGNASAPGPNHDGSDAEERPADKERSIKYDPMDRSSMDEAAWKMLRQLRVMRNTMATLKQELQRVKEQS